LVRGAFLRMRRVYSWHRGVKNLLLIRLPILNISRLIKGKFNINFLRSIMILISSLEKIRKTQGIKGACLHMKAISLYSIKFLVKDPSILDSTTYGCHVSLTNRKIPRILPIFFREALTHHRKLDIKVLLTILGLYRVMPFQAKLNFQTIVEASNPELDSEFYQWLDNFVPKLGIKLNKTFDLVLLSSMGCSINTIKGKNTTYYWVENLLSLTKRGLLRPVIGILKSYPQTIGSSRWVELCEALVKRDRKFSLPEWVPHKALARLSLKFEPGKIRIFAIVDYFTQMVLRPLHKALFEFLKSKSSTDATFDQDKGLKNFMDKQPKNNTLYSFDLSAATDRLPLILQVRILDYLAPRLGSYWAQLLVDRPYSLKDKKLKLETWVRYTTGQPMGALSSWAMLALTHHICVQYAAFKVYGARFWFQNYCILGDDIVIGDSKVAWVYHDFMINNLKVKINLSKSLISPITCLEFAKRIRSKDFDYSPLSLKEFQSWGKVSGAFVESLRANPSISMHTLLRLLGRGSISSGNRNKLYHIFYMIRALSQPDLTILEKFKLLNPNIEDFRYESLLKYFLWSKLWDCHLFMQGKRYEISLSLKNYEYVKRRIHAATCVPTAMDHILKSSLDSSSLYKYLIFGATLSKLDRVERLLDIRHSSYSEVKLDDLLFLWDFNPDEIFDTILVSNKDEPLLQFDKVDEKVKWRIELDKLENSIQSYKELSKVVGLSDHSVYQF
jgi:hypothetical protein